MGKKKTYSAEYKARIAKEALREEKTASEIASREEINVKQVYNWRKELEENAEMIFDKGKFEREYQRKLSELEAKESELMAKIGQLTVENDWLKKKSKELFGDGNQENFGKKR